MKTALILCNLLTFCAISFGLGLAWERPAHVIEKPVIITKYIPVVTGMMRAQANRAARNVDVLAAALPRHALLEGRK